MPMRRSFSGRWPMRPTLSGSAYSFIFRSGEPTLEGGRISGFRLTAPSRLTRHSCAPRASTRSCSNHLAQSCLLSTLRRLTPTVTMPPQTGTPSRTSPSPALPRLAPRCAYPPSRVRDRVTDPRGACPDRLPKLVLKPWVSPTPAGLVLTNAQVIDPNTGRLLEGLQSVVIRDGKIAAVYPIDEPDLLAEEGSLRRVDVGGRYISPGLIDGHVHVTAVPGTHNLKEMCEAPPETISYRTTYVLREMLMRGFTTVRDTGQSSFFARRREFVAHACIPCRRSYQTSRGRHRGRSLPRPSALPVRQSDLSDWRTRRLYAGQERRRTGMLRRPLGPPRPDCRWRPASAQGDS